MKLPPLLNSVKRFSREELMNSERTSREYYIFLGGDRL